MDDKRAFNPQDFSQAVKEKNRTHTAATANAEERAVIRMGRVRFSSRLLSVSFSLARVRHICSVGQR